MSFKIAIIEQIDLHTRHIYKCCKFNNNKFIICIRIYSYSLDYLESLQALLIH